MAASAAYLGIVAIGLTRRESVGGNSQCRRANCVVAMAGNTSRRDARVVSALVTVAARQDAMDAGERAAHSVMVKACAGERLLGVTVATARPE